MSAKDYAALLREVEALKNVVLTVAQNGGMHLEVYRSARTTLLGDKELKPLTPHFVEVCRSQDELWAHLTSIASGDGSYRKRRAYIAEQFRPLEDFIEGKTLAAVLSPHEAGVAETLSSLDSAEVSDLWKKAIERCEADPTGAITAGRSLVESACKHILDDSGVLYADKDDAPTLYKKVSKELNLSPDQHTEQVFKQVLSGASNVIGGMASVANEYGDRHGGGKSKGKPSPRHARLVVNLAGSVTAFLVDTWSERKQQ